MDRDEYLTGRKIDKTFEMMEKEENPNLHRDEDESAPINQLATSNFISTAKNDEMVKMKEDPLFEIKMKQQEQLKQLLQNPLKLKHLQKKLITSLETDKTRKKHKKSEKSKKSKHKKHRSKRHRHSSSSSSSDQSSSERQSSHHRHHHSKRDEPKSVKKEKSNSTTSKRMENKTIRAPERRPGLTEEEKQRRRSEMAKNAEWRDEDRARQVERLTHRERLMDERDERSKSSGAHFIKPILNNIASQASIHDSIRKKRFTSQRPGSSMEANFARK